jgi:branched-chain amino acid aminotransferase
VIALAADLGLTVEERDLPREALYSSDEVFMTGTAAEITPVRSVDRRNVGDGTPGPITRALQQAFFGLFSGQTEDRHGWLELVNSSNAATTANAATQAHPLPHPPALTEATA